MPTKPIGKQAITHTQLSCQIAKSSTFFFAVSARLGQYGRDIPDPSLRALYTDGQYFHLAKNTPSSQLLESLPFAIKLTSSGDTEDIALNQLQCITSNH